MAASTSNNINGNNNGGVNGNYFQSDTNEEEFLIHDNTVSVVNLLTKHKIKLWELPDYNDSSVLLLPENKSFFENLIMKISDESGLVEEEVQTIIKRLQKHSLTKIKENKRFAQQGVANFKLKVIGNNNSKLPKSFNENIEVSIQITGAELKEIIMKKFAFDCDNLKIICNGKIVNEDCFLSSQEIKNHSTLMIMCVYEKPIAEMMQKSNQAANDYKLINDIKDAVHVLSEQKMQKYNDDMSDHEFNIKNQNGFSLDMSQEDTRCLTTAMLLHEKGKSLMMKKEFIKGLILLAEADSEFKNCTNTSLLEKVDNYALLNLDIIWCYLCLENLHELKNAEERLKSCEKCLEKCYGPELERLSLLKSDSANKHTSIFVRLNLLKAILNYHKGKKKECKQFLDTAQHELNKTRIDDDKITQIMSMGFTSTEARLALRASYNNVDAALDQIFKKKQREKELRQLEKQQKADKKLQEKYGLTLHSNNPIDTKLLKQIMQLGYTEARAARALIQADNNFNLALDLLHSDNGYDETKEHVDNYMETISSLADDPSNFIDDTLLTQLASIGYDIELSKLCLSAFDNQLQKCVNYLLENKDLLTSNVNELKMRLAEIIERKNETNGGSGVLPSTSKRSLEDEESLEKKKQAQELLSTLAQDMPEDDEAYLDLNLDEDAFYINKYYSLLDS